MTVAAPIQDAIIQKLVNDMLADLEAIEKQLNDANFNLATAQEFFSSLSGSLSDISLDSSFIDVLTDIKVGKKALEVQQLAQSVLQQLATVPTTSTGGDSKEEKKSKGVVGQLAEQFSTIAFIGGVYLSGKSFNDARKAWKKSTSKTVKEAKSKTQSSQMEIEMTTIEGKANKTKKNAQKRTEIQVEDGPLPSKTKKKNTIKNKSKKGGEKWSKFSMALDGIMFAVQVANTVMMWIKFAKTEEQIKQQIATYKKQVEDAKKKLVTLSADEGKLLADVPSLYTMIKEQINRVIEVSTLCKSISLEGSINSQEANDKIYDLLRESKPFNEDEFKKLEIYSDESNALQEELEAATKKKDKVLVEQKTQELLKLYQELDQHVSAKVLADGFKNCSKLYSELGKLLESAYGDMEMTAKILQAIRVASNLYIGKVDIDIIRTTLGTLIYPAAQMKPVPLEETLSLIANFVDQKATTYTYFSTSALKNVEQNLSAYRKGNGIVLSAWVQGLNKAKEANDAQLAEEENEY